jgi:hypothetical protein
MPHYRTTALIMRVIRPSIDFQFLRLEGLNVSSNNADILSYREPPSKIKRDPTQLIYCSINMDLDQIP